MKLAKHMRSLLQPRQRDSVDGTAIPDNRTQLVHNQQVLHHVQDCLRNLRSWNKFNFPVALKLYFHMMKR